MKTPINVLQTNVKLLEDLNSEITRLERAISVAPEGRLVQRFCNGKERFYRQIQGRPDEYLGKDKEALLAALAQKKFNEGVLKIRYYEKALLQGVINKYSSQIKGQKNQRAWFSVDQFWTNFPARLKPYVSLDSTLDEGFIQKWMKNTSNMKNKEPKGNFYTFLGEHVRSKSEVIIADRLHNAGLHYHYELAYSPNMGADFFYPDFTILHPITYEQWYWEHFGKMDKEDYKLSAMEKLELFSLDGIYPGRNLIITFETSMEQLDIRYVDRLINTFLKK